MTPEQRSDLEQSYLLALMQRDAEIWHQRVGAMQRLTGRDDDDDLTAAKASQTDKRVTKAPAPARAPAAVSAPLPPTYGQKREARRKRMRVNENRWLASLTPEQREARRLYRMEYKRKMRATMTAEQREQDNAKRRARLARETPEQREQRLVKRRAWKAARDVASALPGPVPGSTRPTIRLDWHRATLAPRGIPKMIGMERRFGSK